RADGWAFAVGTFVVSKFRDYRCSAPMRGAAWTHAASHWLRSKATPLGLAALLSTSALAPATAQTAPNDAATIGPVIVTTPKRKPVQRVQTDTGRTQVHTRTAGRSTRTASSKPAPGPA